MSMINEYYRIVAGANKGRYVKVLEYVNDTTVLTEIVKSHNYDSSHVVGRRVNRKITSLAPIAKMGDKVVYKYRLFGLLEHGVGVVTKVRRNGYLFWGVGLHSSDGEFRTVSHEDYIIKKTNDVVDLYGGKKLI